eukprot:TRINITY_DN9347_c0_g1_i2.p2 TRINITY_DN9347_c0_g1~~TRINITY_DN9347_c0_g1_i2.p2  ORF type:complete len:106 (+),score=14.29 TRINITY_DN9347_c0_g1_i2:85-402(+)
MALRLQVKALSGKTVSLSASSSDTVENLKGRAAFGERVAAEKQSLCIERGKELVSLDDGKELSACDVVDGSILFARRRQHAGWGKFEATCETSEAPFLRKVDAES